MPASQGWTRARFSPDIRARAPWFTAIVAALVLCGMVRADDYDRWYAIQMSGGRAGWCHASQKTDGDRITTSNEMKFKIGRAKEAVGIGIEGRFVETKEGKPISMTTIMRLGATPTTMEATYGEKEVKVTLTQSGSSSESTRPLPEGVWLTPAAAAEFANRRLAARADTIEGRTVDAVGGMDPLAALDPIVITHRDCRPTTLEVGGKHVPVTRCITTTSTQPSVESVEYLDDQGIPVRSETKLGGISMTMTAATKEEATDDRAAGIGPEMMTTTFVKPDRPIPLARSTTKATYRVSTSEGKLPAFPTTGAQRVIPDGDAAATVELDLKHAAPAPEADRTDAAYTKASTTLNCNDPEVRRIAALGVAGAGESKAARAEALRRFVYDFIDQKDLGVGFANASETARSKRGDCTEHGVLLAALLRAEGIPSRVACGLIYAAGFAGSRNIFGYHMWSQALLDVDGKPTWVDLDATLGPSTSFDATHIALATSALADGQTQDALLSIATIIGRFQIKVESAE